MPEKAEIPVKNPEGPYYGVSAGNSQAKKPEGPYYGVSAGNSGVKNPEGF
jgi:hypothetical protein